MNELSNLTRVRPDLWQRALTLATTLTGYDYAPKLPLPDGTIYACGGGMPSAENPYRGEKDIEKRLRKLREKLEQERRDGSTTHLPGQWERWIREAEEEEQRPRQTAPRVFVPPGAMEWVLHEVGHYIASTPEERLLPNYGVSPSETGSDGEREWQAWAFEEIILAPFGPARTFAPPTQRDGAAFSKPGPMPQAHLRHAERQMAGLRVDVEEWRAVFGEWIRHESGWAVPSWHRIS